MKKTLLLLVALITATIAFAHDVEIDGIYYNLDHENKIAKVTFDEHGGDYSGDIIIPSKIIYNSNEYSVTSILNNAFSHCPSLTSVTIPYSITSIEFAAFYECPSLTSIQWNAKNCNDFIDENEVPFDYQSPITSFTFGDSVQHIPAWLCSRMSNLIKITLPSTIVSIGDYAFNFSDDIDINITIKSIEDYCKNSNVNKLLRDIVLFSNYKVHLILNGIEITNFTIPEQITSIREDIFYNCSSITSITIPNTITLIERSAFWGCSSLASIIIPNSVTSIEVQAFYGCSSLSSVTIGNNVTSIGNYAFWGCSFTSITIPNSVTEIKEGAFYRCTSLSSITIPNSVISIGNFAFSYCSSLTSINVNKNNPNYSSIDGILYNKDATTLIACPGAKTYVTIPNNVTSIGNYAFLGCSSLTSITIPNSVTSIGNYAFSDCSSLTSITCLSSTPPEASNLDAEYKVCTLLVPKGSLNDYKNHTEWGKFSNIQELEGEKYTITTTVNDDAMGSVTGGGEYEEDSEITLTVTANEGYRFVKWSDGNTDNPRTIIVTQDSTFSAEFALEEFALYATSASPELGYVKHTIEAIAIEGFEFDRWSDGNTDNPRTIILTEDTKLYAYFQIAQGGTPVDLETSKISSANIYTTNGTLHIEGATNDYHILDAAGRLIYSGNASTLQLPRGIYLVTMGGEVEKIVL